MLRTSQRLRWAALAVTAAAVLAAAACGGGTSSKDKTATAAAKPAGSPAATKAAGTATSTAAKIDISGVDELKDGSLDIGSDVAYAPVEFPDAKTILGVSNVSFGLPGAGREVLNSVMLYHATLAGLDFAIVTARVNQRHVRRVIAHGAVRFGQVGGGADDLDPRFGAKPAHERFARTVVVVDDDHGQASGQREILPHTRMLSPVGVVSDVPIVRKRGAGWHVGGGRTVDATHPDA